MSGSVYLGLVLVHLCQYSKEKQLESTGQKRNNWKVQEKHFPVPSLVFWSPLFITTAVTTSNTETY